MRRHHGRAPTPIAGHVDYVAALVDPATKAVAVRILAPNVDRVLRKDMFVRVAIKAAIEHSGFSSRRRRCCATSRICPFVFVARAERRSRGAGSTLGSRVGDSYEVRPGSPPASRWSPKARSSSQFAESQ